MARGGGRGRGRGRPKKEAKVKDELAGPSFAADHEWCAAGDRIKTRRNAGLWKEKEG